MSIRNISLGPMRRADNLSNFTCRLSWNLGTSPSWRPRPVKACNGIALPYFYSSAELRKISISFVISGPSVHPPAWKSFAPIGRIFMKLKFWVSFEKSVEKIQVSIQFYKHNEYFTWISMYFFVNRSLNFTYNKNCCR
jgi:hypothetical protein